MTTRTIVCVGVGEQRSNCCLFVIFFYSEPCSIINMSNLHTTFSCPSYRRIISAIFSPSLLLCTRCALKHGRYHVIQCYFVSLSCVCKKRQNNTTDTISLYDVCRWRHRVMRTSLTKNLRREVSIMDQRAGEQVAASRGECRQQQCVRDVIQLLLPVWCK